MEQNERTPPGPPPSIRTDLRPQEVVERLATASRRGRLPGFERGAAEGRFSVAAFGWSAFDGIVEGRAEAGAGSTTIRFETRLARRAPVFFGIVLALTVWPGVYFMDELLATYWSAARAMPAWAPGWMRVLPLTWWWYLPLTVLPIPWMWRSALRRARDAVAASTREQIEKIAREVDGTLDGPGAAGGPYATPR